VVIFAAAAAKNILLPADLLLASDVVKYTFSKIIPVSFPEN
jgi:hypothetical protein